MTNPLIAHAVPVPAAAAAAYSAAVNTLPMFAPLVPAAIVGAFIAFPGQSGPEVAKLMGKPEAAAECMQRNVASLNTRLVAEVQPLFGTETMGVVLKRGIAGNPLMSIVVQDTPSGSQAEFRPLAPMEQQPQKIAQIVAGC